MCERTVGLTACSKSKRGEAERERTFPARKLYDSWLFDGRVDALEAHCDEWAIFSAKHGYVEPDDQLTWYDKEISELPPAERRELAREVVAELPETDRVMILMGRKYADPLKAALPDDVEVWDPLEGVGLFDQRGELRDLATEGEQQRLVTDGGREQHADGVDRDEPNAGICLLGDERPGPVTDQASLLFGIVWVGDDGPQTHTGPRQGEPRCHMARPHKRSQSTEKSPTIERFVGVYYDE